MTVTGPAEQRIFDALHAISPAEIGFDALFAKAGVSEELLRQTLSHGVVTDLIDAHVTPEPFVLEPGHRPLAGQLIRAMLAQSDEAISLRSTSFLSKQGPTRTMLALCDGSRTRAEIAAAMSSHYHTTVSPEVVEAAVSTLARSRLFER